MGSILDKKNMKLSVMMEILNETVASFGEGPRKPSTQLIWCVTPICKHSNEISNIVGI
jgi:hypothetical protein